MPTKNASANMMSDPIADKLLLAFAGKTLQTRCWRAKKKKKREGEAVKF